MQRKFLNNTFKSTAIKAFVLTRLNMFIKCFVLLLMLLTLMVFFTSCKKSKFSNLLSFSFSNEIHNLDPQTAHEPEEITIINNIFEGLYKKSLNSGFELGVASNLTKTNKNQTYIFTIKDNIYWKTPKQFATNLKLTAKDFVFAFKRLISPNTNSPFASNYFFIKNAKKINEGKMSMKDLGVYENNNNQLVINLEYEPPNLEELLAATPAMPCNEEFFKSTNARYGTKKENVISNGPFFLNSWSSDKKTTRIRIRANDKYYARDNIKIIGVNFSVRSPEESFNMFKNKEINTAIINSSQFNELNKEMIKSQAFQNKITGIIFNQQRKTFADENLRLALALSVDKHKLEESLTSNQIIANNLIPNSIKIFGKDYNDAKSNKSFCPKYSPAEAKEFLVKAKNAANKQKTELNLHSCSILVNNSKNMALNQILQTWQKNLRLFLKIDNQENDKYLTKLQNSEFDCALVTLNSNFNSPASILNKFLSDSSENYAKYDIKSFEKYMNLAAKSKDTQEIINNYFKAEQVLCQYGYFIPIYFETEYFVFDSRFKDIIFNPANKEFYYAYCSCS